LFPSKGMAADNRNLHVLENANANAGDG
jgi:hypothetical protein